MRLEPGSIVPSGECPDCGALCYPTGLYELPKVDLISLLEMLRVAFDSGMCHRLEDTICDLMDISEDELNRLKKVLKDYMEA